MKFTFLTICVCLLLLPVFTQTAKTSKPDAKKAAVKPTPAKSSAKKTSGTKTASAKKTTTDKSKSSAKKGAETKTASAKPQSTKTSSNKPKPKPKLSVEKPLDDKSEFEKAIAVEDAIEKINSARKFLADFPESKLKPQAQQLLAATAAAVADEKLKTNDVETALALYKLAAESAPKPIPDKLFADAISKIPNTLYWRGNRAEALDLAKTIESKIDTTAGQLNSLANFYISIEDGEDAVRVAEKAVQLDPASANSQMTLGLAYRVNFQLPESASAFAKAVEIDGESISARRSLADMKRALGKPDEASDLYRKILEKDESNIPARTGLILSLFDAGKRADAESEMAKSLEQNPSNVILLAGAAYWYAANNEGQKAVDAARKAISLDPRYIWSHIALARGLINLKRPVEAEETLLRARAYGNFPTLEYEIASARLMAGFYRDAAEELSKSFIAADSLIQTKLGGRVNKQEKSFTDLLAYERKASILEPASADDADIAARLKSLLEFTQKMNGNAEEGEAILAADAFTAGEDKMKLHRELYAASVLLDKKIALGKVLDYTKSAIGQAEASLDIPSAGSAIMASQLYDSRKIAVTRNEFIQVPEVPRQTLLAILRGRIEEIAGRALYNQNNPTEAVIRLRRAVSVMPDKSAWWRSSMWHLGAALQAAGNEKEALDTYIRSYKIDKPDMVRYSTIEALYKKLNGSTDGLEVRIGPSPLQAIATSVAQVTETAPTPQPTAEVKSEATPEPSPVVKEEAKSQPTPEQTPVPLKDEAKSEPTSEVKTEPTPLPSPEIVKEAPKVESAPATDPNRTPAIEPTPTPAIVNATPQPSPETIVEPTPSPTPETATPEKTITVATESKPVPEPSKQTELKKDLFEPIIITIPRSSKPKPDNQIAKTEPKRDEPAEQTAAAEIKTDKLPVEEKKPDEPAAGDTRERIVEGKEIQAVETAKCSITATQESLSVINDGGKIGILIGIEGEGDIKLIKASSSSPEDVEVTLEPAGITNREFFVIKSISKKTGLYKLIFELPCGKKEIAVTVR